ncbi:WD40-repeat-containing domain protein [Polychytrium aggregatum]|uniref:WD40-repeat-containing domain protein n=1 Tax=Polychytrium aggregatum TaxID=110093 RepID=UPI0022FE9BE0|nr:WD40-repeat-containing domain protein [Polychytrium aggregatum]KAI9205965.1 WD40-repeat-containing domain protein [Polychytrium aggregatum]
MSYQQRGQPPQQPPPQQPQPPPPQAQHMPMVSQQQQPQQPPQPQQPTSSSRRIPEYLDAIKKEFDYFSNELKTVKIQRDEAEQKLSHQIQEVAQFQQNFIELERLHLKMKDQYEDEIKRLRALLDGRGGPNDGKGVWNNGPSFPEGAPPNVPGPNRPSIPSGHHGEMMHERNLPPAMYSQPNGPSPMDPKKPRLGEDVHMSDPMYRDGSFGPKSLPPKMTPKPDGDGFKPRPDRDPSVHPGPHGHYNFPNHPSQPYPNPGPNHNLHPGDVPANRPQSALPSNNNNSNNSNNRGPTHGHHAAEQPPANVAPPRLRAHQPVTGLYDLDPESPQAWKTENDDWLVVYNHKSPSLKQAKLNVRLVHNLDHGSVVCCVKFSNDGKFLATGSNRRVRLFDAITGLQIASLVDDECENPEADSYVRSVAFSPCGKYLATGAEDQIIRVWDLSKSRIKIVLTGHSQDIYSLDWSKDGKYIVSGSGDYNIRVWDSETGRCTVEMSVANDKTLGPGYKDLGVTSIAMSPLDSRCVVSGSLDRMVRIWDIQTGQMLERFEGHSDSVYAVAFSPDGRSVVSGALDRTLKIWDLSPHTINYLAKSSRSTSAAQLEPYEPIVTTECRHTFEGHRDFVLSVAFAGVNSSLGRVNDDGEAVSTPSGDILAGVEWVVSASKDRKVIFWDGRANSEGSRTEPNSVCQFMLQGHRNSVISIAFGPVGGLFATGSGDSRVRIWRVAAELPPDGFVPAGPSMMSSTSFSQPAHSGSTAHAQDGHGSKSHAPLASSSPALPAEAGTQPPHIPPQPSSQSPQPQPTQQPPAQTSGQPHSPSHQPASGLSSSAPQRAPSQNGDPSPAGATASQAPASQGESRPQGSGPDDMKVD